VSTHFEATWLEARSICNDYGLRFVTLETEEEADFFLKLCAQNYDLFESNYNHIGGIQSIRGNASSYHWVETGYESTFDFKWAPGEPNNGGGKQWCLAVKKERVQFLFDDMFCDAQKSRFVCEKSLLKQNDL